MTKEQIEEFKHAMKKIVDPLINALHYIKSTDHLIDTVVDIISVAIEKIKRFVNEYQNNPSLKTLLDAIYYSNYISIKTLIYEIIQDIYEDDTEEKYFDIYHIRFVAEDLFYMEDEDQFYMKDLDDFDIDLFEESLNKIFVFHIFKTFDIYDSGVQIDIEGIGLFEVKNQNPKQNISEAIEEIKMKRRILLEYVMDNLQFLKDGDFIIQSDKFTSLPFVYSDIDELYSKQLPKQQKLGNYDVNITLPHDTKIDEVEFNEMHITLMKAIQFIEPLMMAVFTNVMYDTFGDNHKNFENSFRLLFSGFFNYLTRTNLNDIFDHDVDSDKYDKVDVDGDRWTVREGDFMTKVSERLLYLGHTNIVIRGTDFRHNPEYDSRNTEGAKNYFGFEFRALDLFPIDYLHKILHLIFMLAEYLQIKGIEIPANPLDIFNSDYEYVDFIVDIIKEGWNTKVPVLYLDMLNRIFHFNLDVQEIWNCYDVLNEIFLILHTSCIVNQKILKYIPVVSSIQELLKLGRIPNINRESFNRTLDLQLKNDKLLGKLKNDLGDGNLNKSKLHQYFPKDMLRIQISEDLEDLDNYIPEGMIEDEEMYEDNFIP